MGITLYLALRTLGLLYFLTLTYRDSSTSSIVTQVQGIMMSQEEWMKKGFNLCRSTKTRQAGALVTNHIRPEFIFSEIIFHIKYVVFYIHFRVASFSNIVANPDYIELSTWCLLIRQLQPLCMTSPIIQNLNPFRLCFHNVVLHQN